jgi:glycosyltransferase involved in cell wall biosynthesis
MNILILTHSFPDVNHKWRGTFIEEQARALSTRHKITIVYFKIDYLHFNPFQRYSFKKTINSEFIFYEVTINKSIPIITQFKYLINTYTFLNREIFSKNKPDIIHSHLSWPAGFLSAIIKKTKGIPNVLTEHSRIKMYFRTFIHKFCVTYALQKCTALISVSASLKTEISQYCNRNIIVIHNLVDTVNFEISLSRKDQVINIGFLGGLNNTNKGLDLLLKSVSMIKRKDIILHIGGNGILLDSYKKMSKDLGIEHNCIFWGEILRSNIKNFYSGLDIFVLPSRYETFGIVLIEAMASGLPVIATKCGGPEDIVTPSTGILIMKDNPEELSNAITYIADNMESFNKVTIRNYATETFGSSVFVEKITQVYHNILS